MSNARRATNRDFKIRLAADPEGGAGEAAGAGGGGGRSKKRRAQQQEEEAAAAEEQEEEEAQLDEGEEQEEEEGYAEEVGLLGRSWGSGGAHGLKLTRCVGWCGVMRCCGGVGGVGLAPALFTLPLPLPLSLHLPQALTLHLVLLLLLHLAAAGRRG